MRGVAKYKDKTLKITDYYANVYALKINNTTTLTLAD